MNTIELCKRLKKAGFPKTKLQIFENFGELLPFPEIDELEEACKDFVLKVEQSRVIWVVTTKDKIFSHGGEEKYDWLGGNFTEESALMKAWLAKNETI